MCSANFPDVRLLWVCLDLLPDAVRLVLKQFGCVRCRDMTQRCVETINFLDSLSFKNTNPNAWMTMATMLVAQKTHLQVDRSAIQPPAIGPTTGPSRGAKE